MKLLLLPRPTVQMQKHQSPAPARVLKIERSKEMHLDHLRYLLGLLISKHGCHNPQTYS